MLSATAYTLRQKCYLAVSLAWVGGFTDAIGFLLIGAFVANMSGNTATLGVRVGEDLWGSVRFIGILLGSFFIGAAVSGMITEIGRRRHYRSMYSLALGCEVCLLMVFLLCSRVPGHDVRLLAAIGALAMGLQNATITQVAGSVVRTTHVTGVVTDLGLETVQFIYWLVEKTHGRRLLLRMRRAFFLSPRHPSLQRLLLLASIWGSFVGGAMLGTLAWYHLGTLGLVGPIGFLLLLVIWDLVMPIATVDLADALTREQEFRAYGIDPTMLPRDVGVYCVGGHGRNLRPPDLGHLHHRAGKHERIVLLILNGGVRLNENSLQGLRESLEQLRAQRRHLVLCTTDSRIFMQLQRSELVEQLGEANLCPDPEFAAARVLELSREQVRQNAGLSREFATTLTA